jgi:hypothetical protein
MTKYMIKKLMRKIDSMPVTKPEPRLTKIDRERYKLSRIFDRAGFGQFCSDVMVCPEAKLDFYRKQAGRIRRADAI